MLFNIRRAVRRFGRLVLMALCSVTRANDPGIQQSSIEVIEFSIGLFSLFSVGEAADT
jgi:hypothetical protein